MARRPPSYAGIDPARFAAKLAEDMRIWREIEARKNASIKRLVKAARACGCMSCTGAVIAIQENAAGYLKLTGNARRWARQNNDIFIQHLREICTSDKINHGRTK